MTQYQRNKTEVAKGVEALLWVLGDNRPEGRMLEGPAWLRVTLEDLQAVREDLAAEVVGFEGAEVVEVALMLAGEWRGGLFSELWETARGLAS